MMTTVKHFHSDMTGAPVMSGTAGSLIAVLDACLVNGFGLKTADSVVVAGGVATANFSTGHSFTPDTIALIAGATPAGLNGEKRVLTTSTNTITFAAAGIADGTATGTITAKLAPAGWEKPFSGTNLAAYRSLDPASTRMFLRVDDSANYHARVVGYESMTDVNTGLSAFPTNAQIAGGGYWPRATDTSATKRAWTVIADSKCFYIHTHTQTSGNGESGSVWFFGDFKSEKSGDGYSCVIQCSPSATAYSGAAPTNDYGNLEHAPSSTGLGLYISRSHTGLGGSVLAMRKLDFNSAASAQAIGSIFASYLYTYPNPSNNAVYFGNYLLCENASAPNLRGKYRGVKVPMQAVYQFFSWKDKIDGQNELLGRKIYAVKCGSPAGSSSQGVIFFDITGPWE